MFRLLYASTTRLVDANALSGWMYKLNLLGMKEWIFPD